jgi:hypothetical protein
MITAYFLRDTPFTGLTVYIMTRLMVVGGILTAIPSSLGSCKHNYDLEIYSEFV